MTKNYPHDYAKSLYCISSHLVRLNLTMPAEESGRRQRAVGRRCNPQDGTVFEEIRIPKSNHMTLVQCDT